MKILECYAQYDCLIHLRRARLIRRTPLARIYCAYRYLEVVMVRGWWVREDVVRSERLRGRVARLLGGRSVLPADLKTQRCGESAAGAACATGLCGLVPERCMHAHGDEELAYFRGVVECRWGKACAEKREGGCWFRGPGELTPVQEVERGLRAEDVQREIARRDREESRGGSSGCGFWKRARETIGFVPRDPPRKRDGGFAERNTDSPREIDAAVSGRPGDRSPNRDRGHDRGRDASLCGIDTGSA